MLLEAYQYDTIWKYSLNITDRQEIRMPEDAQILDFQMQDGVPIIWAAVGSQIPTRSRVFRIVGTGNPFPQDYQLEYIGTVQDNKLVWHLFEEL